MDEVAPTIGRIVYVWQADGSGPYAGVVSKVGEKSLIVAVFDPDRGVRMFANVVRKGSGVKGIAWDWPLHT